MASPFVITEHIIAGQHIREYPDATRKRQEEPLQLVIKQYTPADDASRNAPNAITIIGAHGNRFPKELYEPFWEDLYRELRTRGISLRGIWMADVSSQGASGVLNEHIQGDSASWLDHSRDLLLMINHFRAEMPRPIIGVAHSMGCAQLVHLSSMHPRLLSALVLYEPVFAIMSAKVPHPAILSTRRRDLWPSREAAEKTFRKSFPTWDKRALERLLDYGLRSVPTALYDPAKDPSVPATAVTLTTTKHQEAWGFALLNLEPPNAARDRLMRPEWDPVLELPYRTARPETNAVARNLPYLRPPVLYVFCGRSPLSIKSAQDEKIELTGVGVSGSGGASAGKVEKLVFPEYGHLLVFEQTRESAKAGGEWIQKWFATWRKEEAEISSYKSPKSDNDMLRVSKEWVDTVKMSIDTLRPGLEKL